MITLDWDRIVVDRLSLCPDRVTSEWSMPTGENPQNSAVPLGRFHMGFRNRVQRQLPARPSTRLMIRPGRAFPRAGPMLDHEQHRASYNKHDHAQADCHLGNKEHWSSPAPQRLRAHSALPSISCCPSPTSSYPWAMFALSLALAPARLRCRLHPSPCCCTPCQARAIPTRRTEGRGGVERGQVGGHPPPSLPVHLADVRQAPHTPTEIF